MRMFLKIFALLILALAMVAVNVNNPNAVLLMILAGSLYLLAKVGDLIKNH